MQPLVSVMRSRLKNFDWPVLPEVLSRKRIVFFTSLLCPMQKIIKQVQDASLPFVWLVRTNKVVEILEKNKDKRIRSWKYGMLFVWSVCFIWNSTKIENASKVVDTLWMSFTLSETYSHNWYCTKKKEYRDGKIENLIFL